MKQHLFDVLTCYLHYILTNEQCQFVIPYFHTPLFSIYPGINSLPDIFKHQLPAGIRIIVTHSNNPIIPIHNAHGTLINNHIHTANSVPVILYPIHSMSVNMPKTIIISNIFLPPLVYLHFFLSSLHVIIKLFDVHYSGLILLPHLFFLAFSCFSLQSLWLHATCSQSPSSE